jgi:hypothetical protein
MGNHARIFRRDICVSKHRCRPRPRRLFSKPSMFSNRRAESGFGLRKASTVKRRAPDQKPLEDEDNDENEYD